MTTYGTARARSAGRPEEAMSVKTIHVAAVFLGLSLSVPSLALAHETTSASCYACAHHDGGPLGAQAPPRVPAVQGCRLPEHHTPRPHADLKSWGTKKTYEPIRDPYEITVHDVPAGSLIQVHVQRRSTALGSSQWASVMSALEHDERHAAESLGRDAEVWGLFTEARHEGSRADAIEPVERHSVVLTGEEELAVHAPARVTVFHDEGRRHARVLRNVEGLETERSSQMQLGDRTKIVMGHGTWVNYTWDQATERFVSEEDPTQRLTQDQIRTGTYTMPNNQTAKRWGQQELVTEKSGLLQKHYDAWVVPENLRVAVAHEGRNGAPAVKLVSVAAFPLGATVRVTDVEMEREHREHATVTIQRPGDHETFRETELHAAPGTLCRMEIAFEGKEGASRPVTMIKYFKVPFPYGPWSSGEIELKDEPPGR